MRSTYKTTSLSLYIHKSMSCVWYTHRTPLPIFKNTHHIYHPFIQYIYSTLVVVLAYSQFPRSITTIYMHAFYGCYNKITFTHVDSNRGPTNAKSIFYYKKMYVYINIDRSQPVGNYPLLLLF